MIEGAFKQPYRMSFSTGGLFLNESVAIAGLYDDKGDWASVKSAALEDGAMPFRKASSASRTIREIVNRLECLTPAELELLKSADRSEQAALLWLAICRAYRFVGDFATEVLNERLLSLRMDLTLNDFDTFLEAKAEWHPELAKLSASTRGKLRQVLFRLMREADILSSDNRIHGAILTPRLVELIRSGDASALRFFPGAERLVRGGL